VRVRSRWPGSVNPGLQTPRQTGTASGEGVTPEGYAAACTWAALAPLEVRAGLLAFLSAFELEAAEHRQAVTAAHLSGLLVHGRLTPEGVQAARLALEAADTPPALYTAPQWAGRRNP
jgi:hypothetical protein